MTKEGNETLPIYIGEENDAIFLAGTRTSLTVFASMLKDVLFRKPITILARNQQQDYIIQVDCLKTDIEQLLTLTKEFPLQMEALNDPTPTVRLTTSINGCLHIATAIFQLLAKRLISTSAADVHEVPLHHGKTKHNTLFIVLVENEQTLQGLATPFNPSGQSPHTLFKQRPSSHEKTEWKERWEQMKNHAKSQAEAMKEHIAEHDTLTWLRWEQSYQADHCQMEQKDEQYIVKANAAHYFLAGDIFTVSTGIKLAIPALLEAWLLPLPNKNPHLLPVGMPQIISNDTVIEITFLALQDGELEMGEDIGQVKLMVKAPDIPLYDGGKYESAAPVQPESSPTVQVPFIKRRTTQNRKR